MNLTGNELLKVYPDFFKELKGNYEKTVTNRAEALKSCIFSSAQIKHCLIKQAVGVGFVRVKRGILKTTTTVEVDTESLLVIVSIDEKRNVIAINGGISAYSTCPKENCSTLTDLRTDSDLKDKSLEPIEMDVIRTAHNAVETDLIKLGSLYFSDKAIMSILGQPDCKGIKALLVEQPNRFQGLAICGIDEDSKPLVNNGQIIAYSDIIVTIE